MDGRGAFYLKGKIKGEYLLTAAADTTEQPFRDMFSNFARKDPRFLLRRLDHSLAARITNDTESNRS